MSVLLAMVGCAWLAAPARASGVTSLSVAANPPSIPADGTTTTTVTATATPRIIGESVSFMSSGGQTFGATKDNLDGTYSAVMTSSKTAGTFKITATDTSSAVSGTTTVTQTPGAPQTIEVTVSPHSIPADGSSTSTARATVKDANGNGVPGEPVAFSTDGGQPIGPVTDHDDGTYTATITSTTIAGSSTIKATDGALSDQTTLDQAVNTSTTGLSVSPGSAATNQPVALSATVSSSAHNVHPAGSVAFENGGVPIPGCAAVPVSGSGQSVTVSCFTSFSAASFPQQITAAFSSSQPKSLADSSGGPTGLLVGRDSSSTSLDVSNPTISVGGVATYTVTVGSSYTGPVHPSGVVEFLDAGTPIAACAQQALTVVGSFSTATCSVRYASAGKHQITATYSGDVNFGPSTSSSQAVSVITLPPKILGTITSVTQWTFFYTPSYTKILAMIVNRAPIGTTVILKCHGHGCPFSERKLFVTKPKCKSTSHHRCPAVRTETLNLLSRFRNQHLHPGAQLTIELIRPQWIGKHYLFTIRSGRAPRVWIACLAPWESRPGVGCSLR